MIRDSRLKFKVKHLVKHQLGTQPAFEATGMSSKKISFLHVNYSVHDLRHISVFLLPTFIFPAYDEDWKTFQRLSNFERRTKGESLRNLIFNKTRVAQIYFLK